MEDAVKIRRISNQHQALVQTILNAAPSYYMKIDGVPDAGSAKGVFEELPPQCHYEDKHVLLIERASTPVGVIDTNDVGMRFWPKMGFRMQGRTRLNQGLKVTSTVFVMEKSI